MKHEGSDENTLYLEPREIYDKAILCCDNGVLVYSADKIIELLIENFRQTHNGDEETLEQDAMDYFYFNIEGSYVGKFTPVYEWSYEEEE